MEENKLIFLKKKFFQELENIYDQREIKSLFEIVCVDYLGVSKIDLMLGDEIIFSEEKLLKFNFCLDQLKLKEPIQYIINESHFYSRVFNVNKHVLIPRQETEELIRLILDNTPSVPQKVLDIGTGSGIIPITLNKELTESEVWAIDVSKEALEVAKTNAKKHETEINFKELDVLNETLWNDLPSDFDVIVSNPPYVLNSEKELMHDNVLDYEPHLALFVEDDNALLFYKAITKLAIQKLKQGGKLYFEINERYGKETASLLKHDFQDVKIVKDINGKDRFVYGLKE